MSTSDPDATLPAFSPVKGLPEAVWETLAVPADGDHRGPRSTIKPRDRSLGSTGRGALAQFAELDSAMLPDSGRGRLELGRVLGEGGMGVVRVATQTVMGREVAVKALRTHLRQPGPTLKLLQEAWCAGRLEHPNIVPVYDITVDESGSPLVVLKRIEGDSWAAVMGDPTIPTRRHGATDLLEWHLRVFTTVCSAIHYAHDHEVVHLDLKPENVMIGGHGEVYVVDWGIAMALSDDGRGRLPVAAASSDIVGTPSYMAPEMLLGQPGTLSAQTDVYLLGSILFELMAGRPPHRGETVMEVLHAALMDVPELPEDAPAELAEICRKAMSREPSERFASADELRRAVLGFLGHRQSQALERRASERRRDLELLLEQDTREEGSAPDELFAEACFGYEQALASWSENEAAREGLDATVRSMVEYELAHGDPQAAATHARRALRLPPELAERLESAVERRRANLDELVRLRRDTDMRIGQRTRVFVVSILGLGWTFAPFLEWLAIRRGVQRALWAYFSVPAVSVVVLTGLSIWARESLGATRANRHVVATLFLAMLSQMAMLAGAELMGVGPEVAMNMLPLVWSLLIAMVALTYDSRITPVAIFYFVGFFVGAAWPQWRFAVVSACNLAFTITMVVMWWPGRIRGPMPEIDHSV